MNDFGLQPFQKVILHFDGDSFFASVEQVLNYTLKGKPIVTGGERGAITSASYEAKIMGVKRGVSLRDAKKMCPGLIIVSGNYLSYSIFAERMYAIVREFTSLIEEYSIDECFADITGLDKVYKKSYEEIALIIKEKLEMSLGLTFGVGMASSKVLAKIASKHRKPAGFTVINKNNIEFFLKDLPLRKVWGIGPSSAVILSKMGLENSLQFSKKSRIWVENNSVSKPYQEIWLELQGYSIKELNLFPVDQKSIIKSRTFSPPSSDRDFIFSQLSKNIEAACSKARRHHQVSSHARFYLKTQDFTYSGYEILLSLPTASPLDIIASVKKNFDNIYRKNILYRATGISLYGLIKEDKVTSNLFGESEKYAPLFKAVDNLAHKYGENTVHVASSSRALKDGGEIYKKTLDTPFLGSVK